MAPKGMVLLGGVALLELVWSCRRKYVFMKVGFEVSYLLKILSRMTVHFLLPSDQDVASTMSACTLPCSLL
ncbi:hypothetical protein I79_000213 [Cricetulus griseus]|uniref:Uncharacterized protein n=1 Tax=Cricetulus griseus TaxID=10029 RepID=G3GRS0_CRIGR|nr:hypothetical protein I79_000213 [Cricetulus griseus]